MSSTQSLLIIDYRHLITTGSTTHRLKAMRNRTTSPFNACTPSSSAPPPKPSTTSAPSAKPSQSASRTSIALPSASKPGEPTSLPYSKRSTSTSTTSSTIHKPGTLRSPSSASTTRRFSSSTFLGPVQALCPPSVSRRTVGSEVSHCACTLRNWY